jgi:Beta-galactosidase
MGDFRMRAIGMMLGLNLAVHAQTSTDLRGIYVSGTDFPISKQQSTALAASLSVPGVDGLLLGIAWDSLEPGLGKYDWSTLDRWMSLAVSLGRRAKLSLPAHSAPAWLFQPPPGGAGATPLSFTYAPAGMLRSSVSTRWWPASSKMRICPDLPRVGGPEKVRIR